MDECIGINDDDDSVKFKVSSDYKMRSWMGTWVLVLETPQLKLSRFARVCFQMGKTKRNADFRNFCNSCRNTLVWQENEKKKNWMFLEF